MENKIAEALKVERSTVTKRFITGMPHLGALPCPSNYSSQDRSSTLSCSGTSITSLVTGEMQTCVRLEVNAMTSGAT